MKLHTTAYEVTPDDIVLVVPPSRATAWLQIGADQSEPYQQLMVRRSESQSLAGQLQALVEIGERITELARAELDAMAELADRAFEALS